MTEQKPTTAIVRVDPKVPVKNKGALKALLGQMEGSIADVLPRHLTPERVIKMALIAASKTPKLFECTGESIMQSIITVSELGLDCSGTLGSAYLIPYKTQCTLIIGYRGLIDLARRSGAIQSIAAYVVNETDFFSWTVGEKPVHQPNLDGDPGALRLVWAMATFKDGGYQVDVMRRDEIEATRARSKAAHNGPWVTDYNEMARKTVVRRLCKYLPLSPELEKGLAADQEFDFDAHRAQSDAKRGTAALMERLAETPPIEATATNVTEGDPADYDETPVE